MLVLKNAYQLKRFWTYRQILNHHHHRHVHFSKCNTGCAHIYSAATVVSHGAAARTNIHPWIHTHSMYRLEDPCDFGALFYICVSSPFPLHSELCGVFRAGISPASPGEEFRAWGWACWLSLSIALSQPLLSSFLLTAVILLPPTWGKLLNACMVVYIHTQKYMLMYKKAEVQTHSPFADAYGTIALKIHTYTHQINTIVRKESQKQMRHSDTNPYRGRNNGCLLYQTRSQQSNSVLFLSNERITPTFLINKLTKHYKSPTLPNAAGICTLMTNALSLWYMCWLIK